MQLLETGLLHADPHPGNLRYTPDGRIGLDLRSCKTFNSITLLSIYLSIYIYAIMHVISYSRVLGF